MKILLALSCVLPLTNIAAQSVSGLPIHAQFREELEDLKGPQELISGEYISWNYPFPWQAVSETGQRIPISKGMTFRFIERINTGWRVETDGKRFTIPRPPNSGSTFEPMSLAPISIKGASKRIVENRLGAPTKILEKPEGIAYLYTKEVTHSRTSYDTLQSNTQGTIGNDRFNSTTTTAVPVGESITYTPYSFLIYFNADGNVDHVEDLCTSAAKWERP
jgi:hypothetical protein